MRFADKPAPFREAFSPAVRARRLTSLALFGLLGIAFAIPAIAFATDPAAAKASTSIVGTVSDAIGRPLSGTVIRLQAENGKTVAITRTDSHGRFFFRAIAPGVYAVIATILKGLSKKFRSSNCRYKAGEPTKRNRKLADHVFRRPLAASLFRTS
jgi:hypothetical protein